jgi:hypothetical protein
MLSDGEYVVNSAAVSRIGVGTLEAMNSGAARAPSIRSAFNTGLDLTGIAMRGSETHNHYNFNEQISLFHHGPDAREVLDRELVPRLLQARRNGMLPST